MPSLNRSGRTELTLLNAVILAVVIAIGGGIGIPLVEKVNKRIKRAALLQNLNVLRSQIELYKLEHGGETPVLYKNTFPQLTRATDAEGSPGEPGVNCPFGPYLRGGVPVNSITGCSIVVLTDTFPPTAATGNGGWVYHQATGRIAVDLDEFIEE